MNNNTEKSMTEQKIPKKGRKNKRVPTIIRVLAVIAAVIVLCESFALLFGRDIVISVLGPKGYFSMVEQQAIAPELNTVAEQVYPLHSSSTLQLSTDVSLNTISSIKGYKPAEESNIFSLFSNLAGGTTIGLTLGQNSDEQTFAAEYSGKGPSGTAVPLNAYLTKDRLTLSLPKLSTRTYHVDTGEAPELQPLFDFASTAFGSTEKVTQAQIYEVMNTFADTAFRSLKNSNVTIDRNKTITLGYDTMTLDRITAHVSQQELSAILQKVKTKEQTIDYATGYVAAADAFADYLGSINKGGASFTILVKNSFYGQQVLSQQLTVGKYSVSFYTIGFHGGFTVQTPENNVSCTFSQIETTVNGTGVSTPVGGGKGTDFSFSVNRNSKALFGFDSGSARLYQMVGNKRMIIDAKYAKNKDGAVIQLKAQNGGKTCYTASVTLNASDDAVAIPAFDEGSSIDLLSGRTLDGLKNLLSGLQ